MRSMFPRSRCLLSAACLLWFACLATNLCAYTPVYTLEHTLRLSDLTGSATVPGTVTIQGLNYSGRLVGYFSYQAQGGGRQATHTLAFVWDRSTGSLVNIQNALSTADNQATCVNAAGAVAGLRWVPISTGNTQQQGFVWQSNGTLISFLSPEGTNIDSITAMNGSGQVVGTYYSTQSPFKRAFFWDGINASVDLGDLGDPQHSYVWPVSINDVNQVAGTVYPVNVLGPPVGEDEVGQTEGNGSTADASGKSTTATSSSSQRSAPTAFRWQSGTGMIALDQLNAAFAGSQAAGQNGAGEIVGSYVPYLTSGQNNGYGFDWLNNSVVDLGSLGAGGTMPFSVDELGHVTGTSYGLDQKLHLFDWQFGGGLVDQGVARVYNADTGFLFTSVNVYGDAGGYVINSQGNRLPFVRGGRNGQPRELAGTSQTTLDYYTAADTLIRVFLNDAGFLACSGIDQSGKPVVLMLNADSNGNGLPDGWERQYQQGSSPLDLRGDLDKDGIANEDEYYLQTDPLDYYNGVLPGLAILKGNFQFGSPGSVLPLPIIVSVNYGAKDAPVTFRVTAGGAQIATSQSGPFSSSAVAVQTTTPSPSGAYNQYVAQVWVKLPGSVNNRSVIQISAETAGRTASTSAYLSSSDPSLVAPSNLSGIPTSPHTVDLSWTLGSNTLPTLIQLSRDDQQTWKDVGLVPPGQNSVTVTNLAADYNYLFRSFTVAEANPVYSDDDQLLPEPYGNAASPNQSAHSDGTVTQSPCMPLSNVVMDAEQQELGTFFPGVIGCTDPHTRFLRATSTLKSKYRDNSGVLQYPTDTDSFHYYKIGPSGYQLPDNHYGNNPNVNRGVGGPASQQQSDGNKKYTFHKDYSQGAPYNYFYTDGTVELDEQYLWSDFKKDVEDNVPAFTGQWGDSAGASIWTRQDNSYTGVNYFSPNVNGADYHYVTKARYRFRLNSNPSAVVLWDMQTYINGGQSVTHEPYGWKSEGATQSSLYVLDPTKINSAADASYNAIQIPTNITLTSGRDGTSERVVVVKGDVIHCDFSPGTSTSVLNPSKVTWYYRQMQADGSFPLEWKLLEGSNQGLHVDYTTQGAGIFQIKVIVLATPAPIDCIYTRKISDPYGYDSKGNFNSYYREGEADCFGVTDTLSSLELVKISRLYLGAKGATNRYARANSITMINGVTVGRDQEKCNIFVCESVINAGLTWPVNSNGLPPKALSIWSASETIPNFTYHDQSWLPQPGAVIARYTLYNATHGVLTYFPGWHAHTGILDYDGAWINAGDVSVNRFPHLSTEDYKNPHYRHYTP